MNRIYFVRHGEGVDNVERKFSFRKTDRPLTESQVKEIQTVVGKYELKG